MPRSPKKATSNDATVDKKPYPQTQKPLTAIAKRSWTKEEKDIILFTILDSAQVDWNAIAEKLEGRTAIQVSVGDRIGISNTI
jgi:hypothetical protein